MISPTIVGVAYVVNSTPRLQIEAVDRLEQSDGSDLNQVVESFTAIRKLDRKIANEIEVRDDEIGAELIVVGRSFGCNFSELAIFAQTHEFR